MSVEFHVMLTIFTCSHHLKFCGSLLLYVKYSGWLYHHIFNNSNFPSTHWHHLKNCIIVDSCQTVCCVLVVNIFTLNQVVFVCPNECLSLCYLAIGIIHFNSIRHFFTCTAHQILFIQSTCLRLVSVFYFFIIVDLCRHFGCIAQVFSFPSASLGEVVQERLTQLQIRM